MTMPDERYRAVTATERFLMDLCDPGMTPRIPRTIRQRAAACLRHYPTTFDMDVAAAACPGRFENRDLEEVQLFVLRGISGI
jgi:hypothetical protein